MAADKLAMKISGHPLLAINKKQAEVSGKFIKLDKVVQELREHIDSLEQHTAEMPTNLSSEFTALKLIFKKIDEINSLSSVVKTMIAVESTPVMRAAM